MSLQAKAIAAAVVLIALGALAWRINAWRNGYLERDQAVAQLESVRTQHKADIAALEAARAHELKIAQDASNAYQADLTRLQAERNDVPVVRLCRKPSASSVPAESTTPSGPDAASTGHVGETTAGDIGPDIGPDILEYGIQCEANALQLDRLQEWVRAR